MAKRPSELLRRSRHSEEWPSKRWERRIRITTSAVLTFKELCGLPSLAVGKVVGVSTQYEGVRMNGEEARVRRPQKAAHGVERQERYTCTASGLGQSVG